MTTTARDTTAGAVAAAAAALCLLDVAGCHRAGEPLGSPDSYLVYEQAASAGDNAHSTSSSTGPAAAGLLTFREVRLEDTRAAPIHRGAMDGFIGELLRTDYLAKQLIRSGWHGLPFSAPARARANEPTVLVLAGSRIARTDEATLAAGFATGASFGGSEPHGNVMWVEAGDDPASDPAFVQTASGRIARLIAARIAGAAGGDTAPDALVPPGARALVDGYALAMEVIGREWRVGEGPQGTLPPSAGTGTQRERFAGVRGNAFVFMPGDAGSLRTAGGILEDPGVIATVIHRMAQSTGVGRRVAPPQVYAPFVSQRVPPGVSPAAVLGPIRNFQVKLLSAWAGAILTGHPPHDLADLVTAYADALPAERADVFRIFVVTTYGATVKAGGVSPRPADADRTLAELTTLAAQVTAGKRSLRAAVTP